jgi:hypothetical protein
MPWRAVFFRTAVQGTHDQQTVQACEANLRDEMRMAKLLEQQMPRVVLLDDQDDGIQARMGSWSQAEQAGVNAVQRIEQRIEQQVKGAR